MSPPAVETSRADGAGTVPGSHDVEAEMRHLFKVLAWEIGFPLLVLLPSTRTLTLVFGVLMHIGIGLSIELAMFPLIMLCLYLPLVPWERLCRGQESGVRGQ